MSRVAIIGGEGGMGQCLGRLFRELGHPVVSADVATPISPAAAAASADVVVISVPIRETAAVIQQIGPHVRDDALLMDLTSLKSAPLAAMLEATTRCEVVGAHPMFGPEVSGFSGQRVVLCRGRGEAGYEWARAAFESGGLTVHECAADEHDRMMSIVQVLNHFQTQVMGLALSRLGVTVEQTRPFTSPAYLLESYVVARHFGQDPALYGPIEMLNPRAEEITQAFSTAASDLGEIVRAGDQARFDAVFEDVRAFFGAKFTEEAREQSRSLIERLVELTATSARTPP